MLQEIWNIMNTKIGLVVITGAVSTGLNVAFQKWHMKKDQRVRYENVIGDKIAEAFLAVRDIELEVKVQELYDADNRLKEGINMFSPGPIYPAIMNSSEDFWKFFHKVNEARGEYEKYLDYKAAAYLYYMENYCMSLMKYISEHQPLAYPLAGTVFIIDLQAWQIAYDKMLVKRINRQNCRLYVKNGWRWEWAKKKVMKELWEKSILFKKINEENGSTA